MRFRAAIAFVLCLAFVRLPAQQATWLSGAQSIAPGIDYFTSSDKTLVDNSGPIALYLLELDPARVRLTDTLARGEALGFDTVNNIAVRHNAIAAINGGYFNRATGEPVGVLKVGGELISDYPIIRGVVLIK